MHRLNQSLCMSTWVFEVMPSSNGYRSSQLSKRGLVFFGTATLLLLHSLTNTNQFVRNASFSDIPRSTTSHHLMPRSRSFLGELPCDTRIRQPLFVLSPDL